MCLETSELRFEFGMTLRGFNVQSIKPSFLLGLLEPQHHSLAVFGGQRQGQSVELKAKTDKLIVMLFPQESSVEQKNKF